MTILLLSIFLFAVVLSKPTVEVISGYDGYHVPGDLLSMRVCGVKDREFSVIIRAHKNPFVDFVKFKWTTERYKLECTSENLDRDCKQLDCLIPPDTNVGAFTLKMSFKNQLKHSRRIYVGLPHISKSPVYYRDTKYDQQGIDENGQRIMDRFYEILLDHITDVMQYSDRFLKPLSPYKMLRTLKVQVRSSQAAFNSRRRTVWILGEDHDVVRKEASMKHQSPYADIVKTLPNAFIMSESSHRDATDLNAQPLDDLMLLKATEAITTIGFDAGRWPVILNGIAFGVVLKFTDCPREAAVRKLLLNLFSRLTISAMDDGLEINDLFESNLALKYAGRKSYALFPWFLSNIGFLMGEIRSFAFARNAVVAGIATRPDPFVLIMGSVHASIVAKLFRMNPNLQVRYYPYQWFFWKRYQLSYKKIASSRNRRKEIWKEMSRLKEFTQ